MKKQARSKQPEIKKAGVSKPVALNGTVRLDIKGDPKTEHEELQSMTKKAIKPTARNAITAWEWARQHFGPLDLRTIIDDLSERASEVNRGELNRCVAMLVAQANSLDAIYSEMTRLALVNVRGGFLDASERYLRLGLKAQGQCRATVEALAEMKNPRQVAFVKQANIAGGNQQVNNAPVSSPIDTRSRTEENESRPNKLLTEQSHATVDIGGTGTASCTNTQLETVAKIDRPKNKKR